MNEIYYVLKNTEGDFFENINEWKNPKDPRSILKTKELDYSFISYDLNWLKSFRDNNPLLKDFKIQQINVITTITSLE